MDCVKCITNGIDLNRLNMILAVLEKRCGINLGSQDVYVNIVGGMRVDEPAIDLAIAMAIFSSNKSIVIDPKTVFIGEISLNGQIRSTTNFEKRVKEICKLGYKKVYANKKQIENLPDDVKNLKIELIGINSIAEAINSIS